jgi:hypothetical protein
VGLAALDWANPTSGYDFPNEAAAVRFADAHRTPGRNVVVFSPEDLDIPIPDEPFPVSVRGHRRPKLPVLSDEALSLFDLVDDQKEITK